MAHANQLPLCVACLTPIVVQRELAWRKEVRLRVDATRLDDALRSRASTSLAPCIRAVTKHCDVTDASQPCSGFTRYGTRVCLPARTAVLTLAVAPQPTAPPHQSIGRCCCVVHRGHRREGARRPSRAPVGHSWLGRQARHWQSRPCVAPRLAPRAAHAGHTSPRLRPDHRRGRCQPASCGGAARRTA